MFVPFFALFLVSFIGWTATAEGRLRVQPALAVIASATPAIVAGAVVYAAVAGPPPPRDESSGEKLRAFEAYLRASKREGSPFLAPADMYLHWRLDEPRHGFPHAAHTEAVFFGWWTGIDTRDSFLTPRDGDEYCRLLASRGPGLIVDPGVDDALPCMEAPRSPYHLDALLEYGDGQSMKVFIRD
jgi:hypothetical protein